MNETIFLTSELEVSDQLPNASDAMEMEDLLYWEGVLSNSRFTVQRILVPIVLIVGAVGNSVTIAVMTRRHMQTSTNFYLTALAISDILYLVLNFSLSLKHSPGMSHKDNWLYWHYYRYALWLTDASSSTSIWLTVTFTMERYIAVCHPIKGKVFCTQSRAKKVIIAVYLLCFMLTVTTPHEWIVVPNPSTNGTHLMLGDSDLGSNTTYRKVFYWFSAVCFIVLPLMLLATFNTFLILAVKRSRKQRTIMTGQNLIRDSHASQENKITIMLISVVILALLCQLPTAAMLIYTSFYELQVKTVEFFVCIILNNVFNLLTAINAAANFIFYCALSDRYRRTFLQTFCKKWYQRHSPPPSWMATTGYTNFEDGSPRASLYRGSLRTSRRSSYRGSLSSSPRGSPSHTSLKVMDRHRGNSFLTVPPRAFGSLQLESNCDPCCAKPCRSGPSQHHCSRKHSFRNGGYSGSRKKENSIRIEELESPSSELLDSSLKMSLQCDVVVELQKKENFPSKADKRKFPLRRLMALLSQRKKDDSSSRLSRCQNVVITCQTPSMDDQTAV